MFQTKIGQFLASAGAATFGFWVVWPLEVLKNQVTGPLRLFSSPLSSWQSLFLVLFSSFSPVHFYRIFLHCTRSSVLFFGYSQSKLFQQSEMNPRVQTHHRRTPMFPMYLFPISPPPPPFPLSRFKPAPPWVRGAGRPPWSTGCWPLGGGASRGCTGESCPVRSSEGDGSRKGDGGVTEEDAQSEKKRRPLAFYAALVDPLTSSPSGPVLFPSLPPSLPSPLPPGTLRSVVSNGFSMVVMIEAQKWVTRSGLR